jgi:hypothetical protein
MPAPRVFQLALVDRVYPVPDWFNAATKETVKATLQQHMEVVRKAMSKDIITSVSWSYRAEHVKNHDVVVYFLLEPSQSLIRKKLNLEPPASATAGYTVSNHSKGNLSEVYVDGSMPARRLANVAFHDFMHNKLTMDNKMHDLDGLARYPTAENANPSNKNVQMLSKALFRQARQYTEAM